MRSLVITPTPTHPTDQGNRARVTRIAAALQRTGPVELLYHAVDGLDAASVEAMRGAWDAVHIVPAGRFRPARRVPSHWDLDAWVSPVLLAAAQTLADTTRYDVVVANYVWCSQLLTPFTQSLRVLDTHDRFGDRHVLARAAGMQPHWFYTTQSEEARGFARADVVLAIQAEEASHFRGITATPVVVMEHATPPVMVPTRPRPRLAIGYFGSGNPWNVASLVAFDRLLAGPQALDADFLAFGGITRRLPPLLVFQSAGVVTEPADAYAAVDLMVNPMTGGTGLKIKTVEALAHGRPVLSTRDGGVGLEHIHPDLAHPDLTSLKRRLMHLLEHPEQIPPLAREMQIGYASFYASAEAKLTRFVASLRDGRSGFDPASFTPEPHPACG